MIDRSIRPRFPDGYRFDTQVTISVLSYSGNYPVEILAALAAASALHISDIPFSGPMASLQVARVDGEFLFNPTPEKVEKSDMSFILSGTKKGILMMEGSAQFVKEKDVLEGLKKGHEALLPLLELQDELRKKAGAKEKRKWTPEKESSEIKENLRSAFADKVKQSLTVEDKKERSLGLSQLKDEIKTHFNFKEDDKDKESQLLSQFENLKYETARTMIIKEKKRIDGRKLDQVRPIECETSVLARTHGSSLFTRGETQVLGVITLGAGDDEQTLDTLSGLMKKKFLLHYNFPPFCVGETGRMGGQSRREIGHGFLAEKALKSILPSAEKFPYTIRMVGEVLESNGSSSMGTVCAGSLALMDAGVPVVCPIAGIAMGLIQEGSETAVLSDILGDEDHLGDMDFKVAGSVDGVTAVQMDIKTDSLSFDIIEKALEQALQGRLHILSRMNEVLSKSRDSMSKYAPRIEMMKIHPDKIRDVIGSGGKTINSIIKQTGVKIDIDDDGIIHLSSPDENSIREAKEIIDKICEDVEVGKIYEGEVKKIAEFGAFVEILPQATGLLHISQIAHKRVERVSDYLKEGQKVKVKVLEVQNGRIRLSAKAVDRDN